ncbi:MAG: cryptochrome/photolyase family protein [bacterium]
MPAPGRSPATFPIPVFDEELASRLARRGISARTGGARRRILVLPDQLSLELGALKGVKPREAEIVLVESGEWLTRRPYHRQRLAWILLSQRTFALEAADAGFAVRVLRGDAPISTLLGDADLGSLVAMEPAEREVRVELAGLVADKRLRFVPHDGFLTTATDLERGRTTEGWRMDRFYQGVRQRTGILMTADGKPVGGKYSFDAENRKRWDGTPSAPTPPEFAGSLLREEVVREIETRFKTHPGELDVDAIPASRVEIDRMWTWAKRACLPNFGPYEDAMSRRSRGVFHTRLSPLMNLHRLLPRTVVDEVAALDLPLQSKEGFIRQVLGWREFVYQVHRATDGFRHGRSADERPLPMPGDGGYARWAGKRWIPVQPAPAGVDGGARPNALRADLDLPPAWWGTESGLACLDHVVGDVWAEGWSHHITRLMVLANIATLLGVSPRELCDWFWIAYIDAWDWVVEPNVLAMGTYGDTGMTTKPYVSGSAYLEKMSDSCAQCRFTPGKDCPIGGLYWAFLARNEPVLRDNLRMKLPLASSRNRSDQARASDHAGFVAVRDVLIRGQPLGIPKLIDPAKTKQKGARP